MIAKSLLVATAFLLAPLVAACAENQQTAPAHGNAAEVVRQLLEASSAETAPGQSLELTRVVVPPGLEIASHTHPGPQLAVITAGTLTYSVIRGEVQVTRTAGSPKEKKETAVAGQTVELETGDSIIEMPGMVHTARNAGKAAVIIYLSSLFPTGAPASSPAN